MTEAYDLVRKAFGCEVPPILFKTNYHQLSQEQQDRLYRVARRMRLTITLRYQVLYRTPFENPYDNWTFHYEELPSVELYYLFTCIDTLAAKEKHKTFPDWLRQESVRQMHHLDEATLTSSEVIRLYQEYEDEYGVSRNLRKLFTNLPPSLTEWLTKAVSIRQVRNDDWPRKLEDPAEIMILLREYFYRRRNDSSHESKIARHNITDNIKSSSGWHFTPASFDYILRGRTWNVLFRDGLDEATILRVIIYVVVLQQMHLEVTASMVDSYFESLSRQSALYGFLDEVEKNAAILGIWAVEEGKRDITILDHMPIPH